MDLQTLLAQLLNPNGTQQAQPMPQMAPQQVGDHGAPFMPQSRLAAPSQAPQMPTQNRSQLTQNQPMQPSAPQATADAGYGMGDSGGGIGGLLQSVFAPHQAQKNATVQWLQSQGYDQGTATILASDKGALRQVIMNRGQGKESVFDQRRQGMAAAGLDISTPEGRDYFLTGNLPAERGGAAEMSLNTIPGVDDKGNSVLIQVDKAGVAHKTAMPAGVKISKPPLIKDTGTEFQVIDPITREVVQTIPKNVAGAAAQTAIGTAQGAAAFDLPRIDQNAGQILGVLDRMKTHPGREGSTGFIQGLLPSRTSDQVDFQSLVDQTQGQAFLQAFMSLKGGGQITEIEGKKATDAISRLGNQRLSDADYLQAINDLEGVIRAGQARAHLQAGGGQAPNPGQGEPGITPGAPGAVTPGGQRVLQQMTNPAPMGGGDGWREISPGVRIRKVN